MRYRYGETFYHITVRRVEIAKEGVPGAAEIVVDGCVQEGDCIRLADDRQKHDVEVLVESPASSPNR